MLVKKGRAKAAAQPKESVTFFCFKCKFFSTNTDHVSNHMTLEHLMGPACKSAMDRYVALQTPNLLISTFHNYNEREEEIIQDDILSSDNTETDRGSEMSGIEKITENFQNDDHDNGFITTPPSQKNLTTVLHGGTSILNVNSVENCLFEREGQINTEENISTPGLVAENVRNSPFKGEDQINTEEVITLTPRVSAESVINSPKVNRVQRLTSTGGIKNTPKRQTQKKSQKNLTTVLHGETSNLNVNSVENCLFEREGQINTEEDISTPGLLAENVRNSTFEEEDPINTEEDIILTPRVSVESVRNSQEVDRVQRLTSTGGIRNTPKRQTQKKSQAGKANLRAGGNKKVTNIEDIGEFKTKYRAIEKTKHLVIKHAKEESMNLLKINNTKVDGLDNAENGFFMMYKVGGKTFMVSEGSAGKKFVENEEEREKVMKDAKNIDIQLNSFLLTSLLKSQYATSKTQNTPKSQKRKNYNGIGGENKKRRTDLRNDNQEENSVAKKRQSRKKNTRYTNIGVDDSFVNIDKSAGSDDNSTMNEEDDDDDNRESWLASMINEATQQHPRPPNSKEPRKEARQLFPFRCSECPAKYKTQGGFTKHLREKHDLL